MICVLDVIGGPAKGKRIWVKEDQCVEIGRISTADFSVPGDVHMSRRHLILDSTQSEFRVRDMSSANGTFVNDKRIDVKRLENGDRIRAGLSTFVVSLKDNSQNPHEEDGIKFSTMERIESMPPSITMDQAPVAPELANEPNRKSVDGSNVRKIEFGDRVDLESTVRITQPRDSDSNAGVQNPSSSSGRWFEAYFGTQLGRNVFEQTRPFASSSGEFIGLAKAFSEGQHAGIVVNMSQLSSSARRKLEEAAARLKAQYISQTLCFIQSDSSSLFWEVLKSCLGQDAVICIWREQEFSTREVGGFANAFGYPSLFAKHLSDESHRLNKDFSKTCFHALFEIDTSGRLGLFFPQDKNG